MCLFIFYFFLFVWVVPADIVYIFFLGVLYDCEISCSVLNNFIQIFFLFWVRRHKVPIPASLTAVAKQCCHRTWPQHAGCTVQLTGSRRLVFAMMWCHSVLLRYTWLCSWSVNCSTICDVRGALRVYRPSAIANEMWKHWSHAYMQRLKRWHC